MTSPPWRTRARDLRDEHGRRPDLDDVRGRVGVVAATEQLEREAVREMAAALGLRRNEMLEALYPTPPPARGRRCG